jgi:hypothetical protein
MALISLSVYLLESRTAKQQAHVRVHGKSLRRSRSLARSGFTAEPQGARLTQAERAPVVHAHCADHHSFNNTRTRKLTLHYTLPDLRHAQTRHFALQQFMPATVQTRQRAMRSCCRPSFSL